MITLTQQEPLVSNPRFYVIPPIIAHSHFLTGACEMLSESAGYISNEFDKRTEEDKQRDLYNTAPETTVPETNAPETTVPETTGQNGTPVTMEQNENPKPPEVASKQPSVREEGRRSPEEQQRHLPNTDNLTQIAIKAN